MAGVESAWNPSAENQWGFRGMFQIGKDAWDAAYAKTSNPLPYLPTVFDPQASAAAAAVILNIFLQLHIGPDRYAKGDYTSDDLKAAIRNYNGSAIRESYANEVWDCAQALKAGDTVTALRAIFTAP